MSGIALVILGAVGASAIWMFVVALFLDVIAAQRKAIASHDTPVRLYRMTRTDSDRQIRELLSQNERLARHLIEHAIDPPDSSAGPVVRVPSTWFSEARES